MHPTSAWFTICQKKLKDRRFQPFLSRVVGGLSLTWHLIDDACWLKIGRDGRDHIALRLAYAPGDQLSIGKIRQTESEIRFTVHAAIGTYSIRGFLPEGEQGVLRFQSSL